MDRGDSKSSNPRSASTYGQYLGKRYKDFDNIIWVMGGDRNPRDGTRKGRLDRSRDPGIRQAPLIHCPCQFGAFHARAVRKRRVAELQFLLSLSDRSRETCPRITTTSPSYQLFSSNRVMKGSTTPPKCRSAGRPTGRFFAAVSATFLAIIPCGTSRARSLYPIEGTWQQAMDLPGSQSMMHWGRLFRSRRWFDLVPDQKHEVVTAGIGEFLGNRLFGGWPHARRQYRDCLHADPKDDHGGHEQGFRRTSRRLVVRPRSGRVTEAGEFPTAGMREFTPPAEGDWVLVLDDASQKLPPPGQGS